ncbi:Uncharacterised protein [uncultured archaeon]|nr:Uncharacterised protein [uncultured archaeon]
MTTYGKIKKLFTAGMILGTMAQPLNAKTRIEVYYTPSETKRDYEQVKREIRHFNPQIIFNEDRLNTMPPEEYKIAIDSLRKQVDRGDVSLEDAKNKLQQELTPTEFNDKITEWILQTKGGKIYPTHYIQSNSEEGKEEFAQQLFNSNYDSELDHVTNQFSRGKITSKDFIKLKERVLEYGQFLRTKDSLASENIANVLRKSQNDTGETRVFIYKTLETPAFHNFLRRRLKGTDISVNDSLKEDEDLEFSKNPGITRFGSYDNTLHFYPYLGRDITLNAMKKAIISNILNYHFTRLKVPEKQLYKLVNLYADKITPHFDVLAKQLSAKKLNINNKKGRNSIIQLFQLRIKEIIPRNQTEAEHTVNQMRNSN